MKFNTKFNELPEDAKVLKAVILDVETTGLNSEEDKIIELGMVKFTFANVDGKFVIGEVVDNFSGFEDPGMELPERIKEITLIQDNDVRGESFNDGEIHDFLSDAVLIIAHNAPFDRAFFEERFGKLDGIKMKRWGCSMRQVAWDDNGIFSPKLEWIAFKYGMFYDAHRALEDSRVVLEVLSKELPTQDGTAFDQLLEETKKQVFHVQAVKSPFESKDKLKARGYKWDPKNKFWYTEVQEEEIEDEAEWLNSNVYKTPVKVQVAAINRNRRFV